MNDNDIAIIGMALRAPGARSVPEFWDNLVNGRESIRTLSHDELVAEGEPLSRIRNSHYVPRTADLPDMEMFDAEFFGMSPKEAAIMDPQHRHFLECAWEAFENAAKTPDSFDGPVGVFAGCGTNRYFYVNVCSNRQLVDQVGMFLLRHTGNDKDFLATRASYVFDLSGPSINLQTACSTSLVAVHYACQSLLSGECDMALAGGVTIEFPHRRGYIYQDGEILSPDGHCHAFDHRAAGTIFGSGVGTVVLRRLADALRDGDPIHAVIKATAVNNDGASKAGYLAPSVSGQAAAIIEAQGLAGIGADQVGYVECHGTGTYLGDPIEIEALTQAFRQSTEARGYCRVGSVKTNIGHTDTAAGVIGLIKAALTVKHGQIPPTLGFEKPNPTINFETSPFIVNDTLHEWNVPGSERIAAVNSLGVGGTNAHAIIQAPPETAIKQRTADGPEQPTLLVVTAKSKSALDDAARRLGEALAADPTLDLADAAHTLLTGRKHFEHRRLIPVRGREDAIAICREPGARRGATYRPIEGQPDVAFLFPGGGAQHKGMAQVLYRQNPRFRATIDEGLSYLQDDAVAEIKAAWFAESPKGALALRKPSVQLPAILIVEVALARLWLDWGLKPAVLMGHSMGENAAACVAGVFSFKDVVNLVRLRGELFDEVSGGGMLSVALSEDALRKHLPDELDVASVNAPDLCVVSGTKIDLQRFADRLTALGFDSQSVAIDIAAHSRMLEPILGRFEAFLRSIVLRSPSIPIVSNVSGEMLTSEQARDPAYWVKHLRSTVRFAAGVARIAKTERVFIEVGPGKTLSSLVKAQGSVDANQVINSLPHPDEVIDDEVHFTGAVGAAWATGLPIEIAKLWAGREPRRVALPSYPFRKQRYFLEHVAAVAETGADDPSLGKMEDVADWGYAAAWQQSVPPIRANAVHSARRWLILLDDAGLGAELGHKLKAGGHDVITVGLGDSFRRLESGNYILCPEAGRSGFDELFGDLVIQEKVPDNIVDLWLHTNDENFRPGSSFFHRNQERGFYTLFHLARALGQANISQNIAITVVTNGMQRVGDELVEHPSKSTVLGPVLVLPKEFENLSIRTIDVPSETGFASPGGLLRKLGGRLRAKLDDNAGPRGWFDLLWDDLFAEPANEIVAYRNQRRWVRCFDQQTLAPANPEEPGFKERGVYLITGGLGDLAFVFAEGLAARFQARLVLVGRADLPARDEWDDPTHAPIGRVGRAIASIRAIEAVGGEVFYVRADVTNGEEMRAAVAKAEAAFGRIDGVLHTAGVVKDDLVEMKSESDVEEVMAPKVYGVEVLNDIFGEKALDLFVLFSSTSVATAPAGQIDYVAANAYLNAVAESQVMHAHRRVLSLQWGVWNDVGLAARAVGLAPAREDADAGSVDQPLITRRSRDPNGAIRLELTCSPQTHWILDEHRLNSGDAVWPGTGYIELLVEAAREIGLSGPIELQDVSFLSPLHVADQTSRTVSIVVEPVAAHAFSISIQSEDEAGSRQIHAEARLLDGRPSEREPLDVDAIIGRCTSVVQRAVDGRLRSAQEAHLKFGPRWHVLKSVQIGSGEALAELEMGDSFAGDFAAGFHAHPALLDIATGYAMGLIEGYDPQTALWVPLSYGRIRCFAPLPGKIVSRATLQSRQDLGSDYATFDVVIASPDGAVLMEVKDFTIKRVGKSLSLVQPAGRTNVTDEHFAEAQRSQPSQRELSPAQLQLARLVEQGIRPAEGLDAFFRAIATGLPQIIVSSVDLAALMRPADKAEDGAAGANMFERPDNDIDYVEPSTELEKTIAGFWAELLGIKKIGTNDNFFDLGGHSLIAVRLFRMIKAEFSVDFPISVLFEAPTVAKCAALLERAGAGRAPGDASGEAPAARYTHLVPMHSGPNAERSPFFICAGMFGNILNLRHLALQLGHDRPVYGLQAKGLFGDDKPHETFPEMARDYLTELRSIQPHGPYMLGGFSGGGLVAYEMAQQLTREGESVSLVVMLDTPFPEQPHLSVRDRLAMKLQDIRRQKGAFFSTWLKKRVAWELEKLRKRGEQDAVAADEFHNADIEAAFRRALVRYEVQRYDGRTLLLRPKLEIAYALPDGRTLHADRNLMSHDNGWTPYLDDLAVIEVPGNHDSMVLEPHVRVMAEHVRKALLDSERQRQRLPLAAE